MKTAQSPHSQAFFSEQMKDHFQHLSQVLLQSGPLYQLKPFVKDLNSISHLLLLLK